MTLEIQILDWDKHKIVAQLNRLMGFQPSHPLLNGSLTYAITKMNDRF